MRRLIAALALLAPSMSPGAEVSVSLRSVGYQTRCAEMDNVLVELNHPAVAAFEVVATHPAYLAGLSWDNIAPDFTGCEFPDEPIWHVEDVFDRTLYEDDRIMLRGWRLPARWREEEPPLHIGDRTFRGIHLTQLFVKTPAGPYEVVVLYPPDGYWRARPLPPEGRDLTGYGASFLIGPVETDRRPLVRLAEIRFHPETLTWWLGFARGGGAVVTLDAVDRTRTRLSATLDRPEGAETFAMLSSMHVAPDNADIARVVLRGPDGPAGPPVPIAELGEARAAEAAFGRDIPSRHNASAPDIAFRAFRAPP